MISLYWIQCGGCGADTMSFLNAQSPDLVELFDTLGVELLWHPSLCTASPHAHTALVERLLSGEQPLDILVVDGAINRGTVRTGIFDAHHGHPKKDLVATLDSQARHVVAVGTRAAFGGFGKYGQTQATGLLFSRKEPGDFATRCGAGRRRRCQRCNCRKSGGSLLATCATGFT